VSTIDPAGSPSSSFTMERGSDAWYAADAARLQTGEYAVYAQRIRDQADPVATACLRDLSLEESQQDWDKGDEDIWPDPVPITPQRALPPFPAATFPGWATEFTSAVAESTQTPIELPSVLVLACIAAAAGGRASVRVRADWEEPLNLFTVVAMPPASRKSVVFRECTRPLLAVEQRLASAAAIESVDAQTRLGVARESARKAAARAAQCEDEAERDELVTAASRAALDADSIVVPVIPRLVADDATPEAIGSLLADHGGRIAVLSPEGDVFEIMRGRYSSSPSISVFLKAHAGDEIRVDRKGRPSEHVANPALTIAATVQPTVVEALARQEGFRGRGLLARFLWSLPSSNLGKRRINPAPVPEAVRGRYTETLGRLTTALTELSDPAVLTLSIAAHEVLVQIEEDVEPRLGPGGDLANITDWAGKYVGAVARIAALLHLADHAEGDWDQPIASQTVERAALIGCYFLAHALAAFELMGSNPATRLAEKVLHWAHGRASFTQREVHRAHQSAVGDANEMKAVLDLLVELGWIRVRPDSAERRRTGRPPSPAYEVHPAHR
jgi:replicative DNA helicase